MLNEKVDQLNFDPDKIIKNLDRNGNTTPASIPLALSQHQELFKK